MADHEAGIERLRKLNPDEAALIEALLDIEKDKVLSAALKKYVEIEQALAIQMERTLTRKAELNTDVFNIVGFFSVFQGVILAAVTQLKSDTFSTCRVIPFPITLTVLAAVVGIAALLSKFVSLWHLEWVIYRLRSSRKDAAYKTDLLERYGSEYYEASRPRDDLPTFLEPKFFFRNRILVIVALLLFTGVFIMSYFAILCDRLVIRKWERGLGPTSAPSPSAL